MNSEQILQKAREVMPGGINTVIRNYPENFITEKAEGAYFWDQNGKRYTDYLGAWGPMILGYAYVPIRDKVKAAVDKYDLYGVGVTDVEVELAEKITRHVKGVERVLLCNGGSETTYHAIRAARALTGRKKIVKMQGAFHGWHDSVLMNVISEKKNLYKTDPFSAGMMEDITRHTLICRINDFENLEQAISANKGQVAAILLDTFMTTFGCMRMQSSYIEAVRKLCDEQGILLIYDEVVTGFRVGLGGANAHYNVTPDFVCMGKAIANGYPLAALGGRKEYMDGFNTTPAGQVAYQATYYGNPVMAAAGLATIEELEKPNVYEHMEAMGARLCGGLEAIAQKVGAAFFTEHAGSLIGLYFGKGPYYNLDQLIDGVDVQKSNAFRRAMIDRGQYFAMGDYKRVVLSHAHSAADIDETLNVAESVFAELYR